MTTRITISGPLLKGKPNAIVRQHMGRAIRELVDLGIGRLAQTLRPRPAGVYLSASQAGPGRASTGNYRRHLSSTTKDLNAFITDGGVIYGPWLEGVGSRNKVTRFKGYASFRRTAGWMRKQAPGVVKRHVGRLVRALGGQ